MSALNGGSCFQFADGARTPQRKEVPKVPVGHRIGAHDDVTAAMGRVGGIFGPTLFDLLGGKIAELLHFFGFENTESSQSQSGPDAAASRSQRHWQTATKYVTKAPIVIGEEKVAAVSRLFFF